MARPALKSRNAQTDETSDCFYIPSSFFLSIIGDGSSGHGNPKQGKLNLIACACLMGGGGRWSDGYFYWWERVFVEEVKEEEIIEFQSA